MKVSIDGILGSARKINSQRENSSAEGSKKAANSESRADSVNLSAKLKSRLDSIDADFKSVQSDLTKNQIIRNGVEQMMSEANKSRHAEILRNSTFEGKPVLADFLAGKTEKGDLNLKNSEISSKIEKNITDIKKLQVEVDNISASNLTSGASNVEQSISMVSGMKSGNISGISNLRHDSVMRLVK